MAEDAHPPTVEEFASRQHPARLTLADQMTDALWADVVRLRTEYRMAWRQIAEYLALHGITASAHTVGEQWRRWQTTPTP